MSAVERRLFFRSDIIQLWALWCKSHPSPGGRGLHMQLGAVMLKLVLSDRPSLCGTNRATPHSSTPSVTLFWQIFAAPVTASRPLKERTQATACVYNRSSDCDFVKLCETINSCFPEKINLFFFSCFCVFFRASIDEVETEVVEIEAKLDKVRRSMSLSFKGRSLVEDLASIKYVIPLGI